MTEGMTFKTETGEVWYSRAEMQIFWEWFCINDLEHIPDCVIALFSDPRIGR